MHIAIQFFFFRFFLWTSRQLQCKRTSVLTIIGTVLGNCKGCSMSSSKKKNLQAKGSSARDSHICCDEPLGYPVASDNKINDGSKLQRFKTTHTNTQQVSRAFSEGAWAVNSLTQKGQCRYTGVDIHMASSAPLLYKKVIFSCIAGAQLQTRDTRTTPNGKHEQAISCEIFLHE